VSETCIIIPTYNNLRTLPAVISGSLAHGLPVFVVNDGSTDGTREELAKWSRCRVIDLTPNRGKGYALLAGLRAAHEAGFRRAVTIDSDLQHDPAEIPRFLERAKDSPRALLVGSRGALRKAGAPVANRFGNAASNAFFYLLSGVWLPDTQSGYRSYPVAETLELGCPASRFEFEFVVLVAAARAGIPLVPVPIGVRYEREAYVTHFRPVKDFMRIFRAGLKALRIRPPSRGRGGA